MSRYFQHVALYLAALAIAVSPGCTALRNPSNQEQAIPTRSPQAQTNSTAAPINATVNPSDLNYVTRVVEAVGPAVVRIDSTRTVRQPLNGFGLDDFFGTQMPQRQQVQRGTGSGFIVTSDGRVITNAHVVEGADTVTVQLKNGRQLKGQVIGADPVTDVAVIKVDGTGLPTVKLGNSDSLVPGQFAIAIGSPLGLNNTVTQGIVSAIGRSGSDIGVPDKRINFIQTDAAINPGNSGGPLLNVDGEVIGVNTAIIQGAQGLGFAIPINTAQRVAEQLVSKGRVDHPYLGIQLVDLTPEIQQRINDSDAGVRVDRSQGVLILRVLANAPAARAGLRPGDVIERINETTIQTSTQVQQQIDTAGLNTTLKITVSRNGQSQTVSVRPGELPAREPG
jgi:S1-C subfamily serine protease